MRTEWMTDPLDLAVNALAAYRLTRLITRDSLPPLPALREAVRERYDRLQDQRGRAETHPVAELIECPWCMGFWVSAGVAVAATVAPDAWRPVATVLAFSAVVANIAVREPGDDE